MRHLVRLILLSLCLQLYTVEHTLIQSYLGSREGDPASLIKNVSVIHGDYSEREVDLVVPGPDPLALSRYYSSRDTLSNNVSFGGWRFQPHCFLRILQEDHPRSYTTAEGKFQYTHVLVGTPEGSILTYAGWKNTTHPNTRSSFKIDVEKELFGIANTARENINTWTNLKNQELIFDSQGNHFQLNLSSGGKRVYVVSLSNPNFYLLTQEILPSGNKIFYEYERELLSAIRMTNASEQKILSWIQIQYGANIHIETSDQKSVDYYFQRDLLSEVIRSHTPSLKYEYRLADDHPLLIKKELPERRYVTINYYTEGNDKNKVAFIATAATDLTRYSYGNDFTQVDGPLTRKATYRFDDRLQLTAIEEYLGEKLYRIHKKSWGKKQDASHLIGLSIEDGNGSIYYHKSFSYDEKGNLVKEKECGNLTGTHPEALAFGEEENLASNQESHTKTYSYRSDKDLDIVSQNDSKGSSIKFFYKKGTNFLVKKLIFEKKSIKKRWFYQTNEDGLLTKLIVDDGDEEDLGHYDIFTERHITTIIPKPEFPNLGIPEVIEEKYFDTDKEKEILLKRTVNSFDSQGNVVSTAVYDAKGEHRYTLKKTYDRGLLSSETDPFGNEIHYSYDANQNLIACSNPEGLIEYRYDLDNRVIGTTKNHSFETQIIYDRAGDKLKEIDPFGHTITYTTDDLGRVVSVTYPEVQAETPHFTYTYNLFDCISSTTNPQGETTLRTYTVRGTPTQILYPDGSQELFKYDPEGSLHRHLGRDGIIKVFEYDALGRLSHIEYYQRDNTGKHDGFKREYFQYNDFHLISYEDEEGSETTYTYDKAGRLQTRTKGNQKQTFVYDALGRTHAIKKWKSSKDFTLEVQEHDLLDRIIEERVEDSRGKVLLKSRRTYDSAGHLQEIIGYPSNQECVLAHYVYDDFGRLNKIQKASGAITAINYQDDFINEWGQKVLKRTRTDPFGTQTEDIFDPAGRIVKTTQKDKSGTLLSESTSLFDLTGNPILEKNAVISLEKVLREQKTEYSYNTGKLSSTTVASGEAEEKATLFEYDKHENLFSVTYPELKEPLIYQYDDEGNICSISGPGINIPQLSHDRKGRLQEVKLNSSLSVSYNLSANDELLSETVKDQFGSYQVKISYDGEGCIEAIQLPDGSLITYTYEGPLVTSVLRQSKEKKERYAYQIIARDLMGHVLEEILPQHAGARKQTWDQADRRTGIITDFFSDEVPENGYDVLCNIKQKIFTLDGRTEKTEYDYNALGELIAEKGTNAWAYYYDSLGNRLKRDDFSYEVNLFNQILKAEGMIFSFDPIGHLKTKIVNEKTWEFHTNLFGHLASLQGPDQPQITFTYDLDGKRLSKKIETKGKKPKISRYFYLGHTELGALDEKGRIIELKVPSNPNRPESSPSIAIEIQGEMYVPLYDLQSNIICLIDPDRREIVESYSYSAFGVEEITNERGIPIQPASALNPWRYKGKRVDAESGLVYFGKRYYDPQIGRWISPDPLGNIDGPNLYRFCRNNPVTFIDYFGLATETNEEEFNTYFYGDFEPYCHCEAHRDCKRGGDIQNALGGISLGIADYGMSVFSYLVELGYNMQVYGDFGTDQAFSPEIHDAMLDSMHEQHNMWREGLVAVIEFDPQSEQARAYERGTYIGMAILDALRGNVKDIRKGLSVFKNKKYPNLSGLLDDLSSTIRRIEKGVKFPHRNDGAVFRNREGLLPVKHSTYYREYVHPTPGLEGPGPQRIVIGENFEIFYTPNHYKTFIRIK